MGIDESVSLGKDLHGLAGIQLSRVSAEQADAYRCCSDFVCFPPGSLPQLYIVQVHDAESISVHASCELHHACNCAIARSKALGGGEL